MASAIFSDPIKLLRLAPLVSNSFSLMFAWDQHLFFMPFLRRPIDEKKSNAILPTWMSTWFPRCMVVIGTLYPFTMTTALANVFLPGSGEELKQLGTDKWYLAGFVLTLAHIGFAPRQVGLLHDIIDDKSQGRATDDMRSWIVGNLIRNWVTDTSAWLCYVVAVMGSLSRSGASS